jgi:hypothetical protein
MPQPRSPEEWVEMFANDGFQGMLPQEQIKAFMLMAREDPLMGKMPEPELMKLRNQFQGEAQAVRQARQLGRVRVEPYKMTESEKRQDLRARARETAAPYDLFKATTEHIGAVPIVGDPAQNVLESAAESFLRSFGSEARAMGTYGEAAVKNIPLDLPEYEQPEPKPPITDRIATAEWMKRDRERQERNRQMYAEERAQAGRETAQTFFEAADDIDRFAEKFGRDQRTSFKEMWSQPGVVGKVKAAPELIFQTFGDVAGYALPYILGPKKFRHAYLLMTGTGEVAERAYEKFGSSMPEFSIPAGAIFALIERAFGPEAWVVAAERAAITEAGKKFVATFLKDPKRAAGLANTILGRFFKYGAPEAVTEGAQEYIVTQAEHADEPELTLDTWNTLDPDEREQITEAFGATLLTLGTVGIVKGKHRSTPEEVDAGPAPAPVAEYFPQQPARHPALIRTPEQQAEDAAAAAPVISRYRQHADNFSGNPEMQAKFQGAADSVQLVEPTDNYTNVAKQFAERLGFRVRFFTDNLGRDPETGVTAPGVRGMVFNNETGDMLIRVDPNNTRAAAGNILKGMLAQMVNEDPARVAAIAEILKNKNPELWKAAQDRARQFKVKIDDNLGILSIAVEMSTPDVIAAASNPQLVQEIADGVDGEIFTSLSSQISRYGRKFIENFINPRLVNNFSPGSLRYAMRNMTDVPLTAQDIEGRRRLAETAQLITQQLFPDGSRRVHLSTSDTQPVIFENLDVETPQGGASDYQIGPRNIADQGTKWSRWVDDMFQKWIDDRLMMKDVERQIKEQSLPLTDDVAMSQTIDTQNSRTAEAARKLEQDVLTRIEAVLRRDLKKFKRLFTFESEFEKFGDYLRAVTAIPRNAYLASVGKPPSGMSDRRANEIIQRTQLEGRTDAYEEALNIALEIPNLTMSEMLDNGLISPEAYIRMRAAHPRYLPMMDEMILEAVGDERLTTDSTGTAIDVDAKKLTRRIRGTTEEREIRHPLRQLFQDTLMRMDMIERNKTMQTVYRFAQKWGGKEIQTKQEQPAQDSSTRSKQLSVYFNGVPHVIEFDSAGKRNQFANLSTPKLHWFFRAASKLTNLKARAATTFSIPFWFVNFPRDLITAYLQSDSEEMGIQTLKNVPRSLHAIMATEFPMWMPQQVTPEFQDALDRYELYRNEGGQLSFMGLREMYRDINKLVHKLGDDKSGVLYRLRAFVDLMDSMSSVLENTTRLAAFNAAVDSGATPRAAAHYARNITVDFDRKTDSARKLNTLYVFANANLQGTARIMRALWKSPHGRRTLMQYGMIGFLAAVMSRMTSPEEWDKISDDEKSRNLIFLNPDGTYNKIPLPPGLAFFFRLGAFAEEIAFDDRPRSKLDTLLTPLGMILDEFSPLAPTRISGSGFGGNLYGYLRMFLPTGLQELTDIAQNQSVWGQEIYPEPGKYEKETPRSELMFGDEKSTLQRRVMRPVTEYINELGGGNEMWPGTFWDADVPGMKIRSDYSPEAFEYVVESFLSGPLAFTNRAFKLAQHYDNIAKGREVPPIHENMIPIVRRFHSRATDYEIGDEYYSIRDSVQQAKNVLKSYDEFEMDDETFAKWDDRHGWMLELAPMIDETEARLTELRKNRTESTYRADSEERMRLQREVVEEFYDLWSGQRDASRVTSDEWERRRAKNESTRFYDETALRVATDQMGVLSDMLGSETIDREARAKYLQIHGWKTEVIPEYKKWFESSMRGDNERTVKILRDRFLDKWYDVNEKKRAADKAAAPE